MVVPEMEKKKEEEFMGEENLLKFRYYEFRSSIRRSS